jgi:SAM-dependent methyltransferase
MSYYQDKLASLQDLFGTSVLQLSDDRLTVGGRTYPILNDVILLLDPSQYPASLQARLQGAAPQSGKPTTYAEDIQFTFGEEWTRHPEILAEHEKEFMSYFDLVDLNSLGKARVCDLGCGIGRWSYFLTSRCREMVLVDFSEAIFVARKNLSKAPNTLFFMGDLERLPFRDDFCDFLFCLGVLHHLPTPCLKATRSLRRYSKDLLIFLYYALDNRPIHYRLLLAAVTSVRKLVSKVRSAFFRDCFSWWGTALVYEPLVILGRCLKPLGIARHVPLYDFYHDKGFQRIRQDVYDRFFTRIEQRVSRKEIMELQDTFARVEISPNLSYWHFRCRG